MLARVGSSRQRNSGKEMQARPEGRGGVCAACCQVGVVAPCGWLLDAGLGYAPLVGGAGVACALGLTAAALAGSVKALVLAFGLWGACEGLCASFPSPVVMSPPP